jgi:FAD binding domain
MATPYVPTSHESFTHDSIDSLSYDWERIGHPGLLPKHPFKVYFPQTAQDVVTAVREASAAGQELVVRANGHSSNDLVTVDGGVVLCTHRMNRVLDVDPVRATAVVQPGIALAQLDEHLRTYKFGLPVIGDHNHVTAGGFASVGGISPASHRYGMFVDNVLEIEYVDTDGEVHTCSKRSDPARFYRILGGLGKHGIITSLKLRIVPGDKYSTLLANDYAFFTDMHAFLAHSGERIRNPGEALMERGLWVDFPIAGTSLRVGQFSAYHSTKPTAYKIAREKIQYTALQLLGSYAGRLPTEELELLAKYAGIAGILIAPPYATIKNIENFTDRILDESTGDPTRMFIALAPQEQYETLFRALYQVCLSYRATRKCFTFLSIYVKSIHSAYLSGIDGKQHCELMLFLGLDRERMTPVILEEFVSEVDDLCIEHGAFRYMHSRTVKDARRALIDPNEARARVSAAATTQSVSSKSQAAE